MRWIHLGLVSSLAAAAISLPASHASASPTRAEKLVTQYGQHLAQMESDLEALRERAQDVRSQWRQLEARAAHPQDYERIQLAFRDASDELTQKVSDQVKSMARTEDLLFEKLGLPQDLGLVRHAGLWNIAYQNKLIPFIQHYDRETLEFMLTEAYTSPLMQRASDLVIRVTLHGPSFRAVFNRETDEGETSNLRKWPLKQLGPRDALHDFAARQCQALFR